MAPFLVFRVNGTTPQSTFLHPKKHYGNLSSAVDLQPFQGISGLTASLASSLAIRTARLPLKALRMPA